MTSPVFPNSIDSTMISTYTECPQKFFIEYCLKLSPVGISPDLHAGGVLATGMEVARKEFYFNKAPADVAVGRGFQEMIRAWGDYIPPEKHPKTFTTTCFAMTEYFREFPLETDIIQPYYSQDGEPAVEFTIAIPTEVIHPVTGDPILYSGRCDMLGRVPSPEGGMVNVVVDEKTTKGIGPRWKFQWNMRGQFYGYTYAVNQGGIHCEHALVRAISLQKTVNKFSSILIPIPLWRQERWWQHTQMKLRELVDRWHLMEQMRQEIEDRVGENASDKDKLLAMNTISHTLWTMSFGEACENYGGCSFKSLCTRKNPAMWYDDYAVRNWDPLAKDPTADSESALDQLSDAVLPDEIRSKLGFGASA